MTRTLLSWQGLFLGCAVLALALTAPARAEEDGDQGKKKGKGSKAEPTKAKIIQVDTSKLPPKLVKQLEKYLKPEKKMAKKGKGAQQPRMKNFGKFVQAQLAQGLRGTALAAAIHQEQARRGVVGQAKRARETPAKKGKKDQKGKKDRDYDD